MFNLSSLYSNETYKTLLLAVLKEVATYPHEHEDKVYIGGTIDSNQSLSERQYLSGMLGVVANSEKVGNILVMIVGMIIDDNYEYLLSMLSEHQFEDEHGEVKEHDHENFTINEIIEFMSSDPEGCNSSYPLTEDSVLELQGNTFVVLNPEKINRWNLQRVTDYITREHDFSIPV